jgi:hypothetical protein
LISWSFYEVNVKQILRLQINDDILGLDMEYEVIIAGIESPDWQN